MGNTKRDQGKRQDSLSAGRVSLSREFGVDDSLILLVLFLIEKARVLRSGVKGNRVLWVPRPCSRGFREHSPSTGLL